MHASNSVSPKRRRQSPDKHNSLEAQTIEDVKSLRLQLTSLKKQLTAQEQDNMTLIAKVTALKDTIDTQERNYDALVSELEEKQLENAELLDSQEELQKHVDSLLAECAELR